MLRFRSINQTLEKIKTLISLIDKKEIYSLFMLIIVGFSGYFLGGLSTLDKTKGSVALEQFDLSQKCEVGRATLDVKTTLYREPSTKTTQDKGIYVGSRNGNKYHLPDCPGAERILEANMVWFSSKEEALRAGYTPAANCKDI